jgi:flagellar hook-associated protein 1 FlgK
MALFHSFSIGRTALQAFKQGLDVAGYNVANAHTPGFSRRRVELGQMMATSGSGGALGMGVEVSSVRRIRDPFLDFAVRREMGRLGRDESRAEILGALEPMLGEVETATLRTSLSDLFDAIESLAVQPDDMAIRENVIGAAGNVAETIQRTDRFIVENQKEADERLGAAVESANAILEQLAQINQEIAGIEAGGDEASSLRDQRGRLLDELGKLVEVRAVENEDGQVSVYMDATGDTLLSRRTAHPLQMEFDAQGFRHVTASRGGEIVDLSSKIRSGKIGGYLKARDEDLAGYREQLDALASAIITEFNAVHQGGFDLNGDAGQALFQPDPPGDHAAAAIRLNASIRQDARLLATGDVPGEPGNNNAALALLELREKSVGSLSGRSLTDYSADLISAVGTDHSAVTASQQASETIVDSLESKRQSISGVSLDEEAADLARWQQSFDAAARYLQAVNRLTEISLSIAPD